MKHVKTLLSFLAGCLLPFAFAPYNCWPVAILSPTILLFTLTNLRGKIHFIPSKLSFLRGFLFGVGLFGAGASWIFVSIHTYGNTHAIIAALITLLFVCILALFPALQAFIVTRCTVRALWFSLPAAGVLLEWIRSWFFSGFPWLLLGQSQTLGAFKGFVPLVGAYGASFLLLLSSVGLFFFCRKQQWRAGLFLICILLIGYVLSFYHWTHPSQPPIKVSLVQGNVPQEIKWSADQIVPTLKLYADLTQSHWADSRIIFWPEGAIPLPLQQAQPFLDKLSALAKHHHATVVLGLPVNVNQGFSYYNAIAVVGESQGFYYKRHLVPFGEYVPLASALRGLIGFFNLPMSDFIAGERNQAPLQVDGATMGAFICYEVAYSHLLHDTMQQHPDFLATLSNDAWFGESWAPYQHAQIAQFAALVTGRYMVLNANSGLTAIYDAEGKEISAIPLFTRDVLTGQIRKVTGETPWNYYGDWPALLVALMALSIAWRMR